MLLMIEESTQHLLKSLDDFKHHRGNSTKTSLAAIFDSNDAQTMELLVSVQVKSCMSEFNQLSNKVYDLHQNLKNGYNKSFHLVVPAANDQLISRLELTRTSCKMVEEKRDPVLKKHLSSLTTKRCQSVVGLVCRVFDRYKYVLQQLQNNVMRCAKDFEASLDSLKKNLQAYASLGSLDHNFIRSVSKLLESIC